MKFSPLRASQTPKNKVQLAEQTNPKIPSTPKNKMDCHEFARSRFANSRNEGHFLLY